MPSKNLIEASEAQLPFCTAMSRVPDAVSRMAATETAEVLRAEGIDVVDGRAQRTGTGSVVLAGRALSALRLVLAVGAAPLVPDVPGVRETQYLTSETVWDLTARPNRLVVPGGGAVGCELAHLPADCRTERVCPPRGGAGRTAGHDPSIIGRLRTVPPPTRRHRQLVVVCRLGRRRHTPRGWSVQPAQQDPRRGHPAPARLPRRTVTPRRRAGSRAR